MSCTECDTPARSRGLCNLHYHRARRIEIAETRSKNTRAEAEYRLGELAWLIDGGVYPPEAARRCDWTVAAAEKCARRYDRGDIARTLWQFIGSGRSVVAA